MLLPSEGIRQLCCQTFQRSQTNLEEGAEWHSSHQPQQKARGCEPKQVVLSACCIPTHNLPSLAKEY